MNRAYSSFFAATLLLAAALPASAGKPGLSGAIFTTTADGTVVNGNHFPSKCAVYLDGGPGPHAPAHAAGLPDGDYYFQVTDPSGHELLSTDPVSNRRFQVSNGVIVAYTGTGAAPHPIGTDQDHPELGAITISLANDTCPEDYLNTPNNGGVYKVWATPAADFVGDPFEVDNACGNGCYHGFVPSKSKTDNFKAAPSEPTFCLTPQKEISQIPNVWSPADGWPMHVTDPTGVTNTRFTGPEGELEECGLAPGVYTVAEAVLFPFEFVELHVNGILQDPGQPVYSFEWQPGDAEPVLLFRNKQGGILGLAPLFFADWRRASHALHVIDVAKPSRNRKVAVLSVRDL